MNTSCYSGLEHWPAERMSIAEQHSKVFVGQDVPGREQRDRAFTAIELLVVIAVLALLAAVLLPSFARGGDDALTTQCLSNKRQLAIFCQMYSTDNSDFLVPNAPVGAVYQGQYVGWCPGQENWGSSSWNTNAIAYKTNGLGPYVNDIKLYKCPADTIPSDNGERIRSISMNPALLGSLRSTLPSLVMQIESMLYGWKLFEKVSDLGCMGAANAWVFCDESMYSLEDGYLQCNFASPSYPNVPAAYHGAGNCFAFADGHGEFRRWRYGTTDPSSGLLNCPVKT